MDFPFKANFEKTQEKQKQKQAANGIGAAYSCMFAVSFLVELVLVAVLSLALGIGRAKGLLSDPTVILVTNICLTMLMFTIPYIVVTKILKHKISCIAQFKRPKPKTVLPYTLIGVGVCSLGEILTNWFVTALSYIGIDPAMPTFDLPEGASGVALTLVAVAVLPALLEEFALRGVVMGLLRPFGDGFAILLSAIVFALMHGNLVQIPFAFVVGLSLAFATVKSGSVWTAVLIHFINNARSVLCDVAQKYLSTSVSDLIYLCSLLLMLFAGIIGVVIAFCRDKEAFSLGKSENVLTFSERMRVFFSAPFVIISLVITLIQIIVVQVMY